MAETGLYKILAEGEEIEHECTISNIQCCWSVFGWLLLSLLFFPFTSIGIVKVIFAFYLFFYAVAFPFLVFWYFIYLKKSNYYIMTNKNIIQHSGWFSSDYEIMSYSKVTDVRIVQGILDRYLFNIGTIYIDTAGSPEPEAVFYNIDNPLEIEKLIVKHKRL